MSPRMTNKNRRNSRTVMHVVTVNSDENRDVTSQYQIQGIPTLLFLKNGELVDRVVGVVPKQHLVSKIQQLL